MHLTLHLTDRCNMRCRYCYAAPHTGGDMTFETAKAAINVAMDEAAQRNPGMSLGIIFFGGEPLLKRPLIKEIVSHCAQITATTKQLFHFKITTNGLLLDEDFLTDPDTKDILIALSMDGGRAVHDTHRVDALSRPTFDKIEPVAELLLSYRPYSPVMAVVTPATVHLYADAVNYLYEKQFRYLIFSLDYSASWEAKHLTELRRQYKKLARWYMSLMRAEEKFYFSPFEVKIASRIFPEECKATRCELGMRQISVAPDGTLYPCVQFATGEGNSPYSIGHVSTGIDQQARERLYRKNAEEKSECAECAVRARCSHFCGCLNRQATGSIEKVSPVLCAHERIALTVADGLAEKLFKERNALFIQKHYNQMFPLISLVEDRS